MTTKTTKPTSPAKLSYLACAERVLRNATTKQPMHYEQITNEAISQGWLKVTGKTPQHTMRAIIRRDISDQQATGNDSHFYMDGALVGLSEWHSKNKPASHPTAQLTFVDSAEKVLDELSGGRPMHYTDITKKAQAQGWLKTDGKTPWLTMYARLSNEIRQSQTCGEMPRFTRQKAKFGLSKWVKGGQTNQQVKDNQQLRSEIRDRLMRLKPEAFEALIKELLIQVGFTKTDVTTRSRDGGIDVRGTYTILGKESGQSVAIQAKRWKRKVNPNIVRQVRGSTTDDEIGMIITTGGYTKMATEDAKQENKATIHLINGDELISLLIKYEVGVVRESPQFHIDEELLPARTGK